MLHSAKERYIKTLTKPTEFFVIEMMDLPPDQKLQSSWCTPTAATPTDAWLCPTPFRVKLHMFKKYADLFHDLNSRQLRGAPMLPTAATALPAAQFAHVFEKYADLFHDLNSRQLRGAPRGQEIRRFVS